MKHNDIDITSISELLDDLINDKDNLVKETNVLVKKYFIEKNIIQLKQLYKDTIPLIQFYNLCEQKKAEWWALLNENRN